MSTRNPQAIVHTLAVRKEDGLTIIRGTLRAGDVLPGMRLRFKDRQLRRWEVEVVSREDARKHVEFAVRGEGAQHIENGRFLFLWNNGG